MTTQDYYVDRPWMAPKAEPFIKIQSSAKQSDNFIAINNVDLESYKGEFFKSPTLPDKIHAPNQTVNCGG
jgi:hypothetical protein